MSKTRVNQSIITMSGFLNQLEKQHQASFLALHMTRTPSHFYDKLEDRRIINNLRDDDVGRTEIKGDGYIFYPQISATVLPKAEYKIQQDLYPELDSILFVGLDLEKSSKIKGYAEKDMRTAYQPNTKTGRSSYQPKEYDPKDWQGKSHIDRLTELQHQDHLLTQKSSAFSFETKEFLKSRQMNEVVVKVNVDSMLCLGALAEKIDESPRALADLILHRHQLREHLGVNYPIVLYNNTLGSKTIDFIGSDSKPIKITIESNGFFMLDETLALSHLRHACPQGIRLGRKKEKVSHEDFYKQLKYKTTENGEPIVITDTELQQQVQQRKKEVNSQLDLALQVISEKLPAYSKEDYVIKIHKQEKATATPLDQYNEIDQAALKKFIKIKIFGVSETFAREEEDKLHSDPTFIAYVRAYNLQFRLSIYKELLTTKDAIVNFSKLKEDLDWCDILSKRILARPKSHSVTDEKSVKQLPKIGLFHSSASAPVRKQDDTHAKNMDPQQDAHVGLRRDSKT